MYGSKFSDMWAGVDPTAVRISWARKLGGFISRPECIRSALDDCDGKPWPPTLPEFLSLCRDAAKRTGTNSLSLPAPEISREEIQKRSEQIEKSAGQLYGERPTMLGWAHELKARHVAGEMLITCQKNLASGALGEQWGNAGVVL